LVVGVSTRAMFDLAEEDAVFQERGVAAYAELQLAREKMPLRPGTAFEVTRRLLALNQPGEPPLVQVVLLSKNSPDLSLRAFYCFEHHGLPIIHGSFTSGRSVAPLVLAWNMDLFLSNDDGDVRAVAAAGIVAARLGPPPTVSSDVPADEVRFAFDAASFFARSSTPFHPA
jgi:5'-nucleotidase